MIHRHINRHGLLAGWILLPVFAGAALAGPHSASAAIALADPVQTCRADLNETGKQVFDHIAPDIQADTNIRELMRAKVPPVLRPKVLSGAISRQSARDSTQRAGQCLAVLKTQKSTTIGEENDI